MTPSSAQKRERERMKAEKAQAKAERTAARQAGKDAPVATDTVTRSEEELVEELAALHRALETGAVSHGEFEQRRAELQAEFDQLL